MFVVIFSVRTEVEPVIITSKRLLTSFQPHFSPLSSPFQCFELELEVVLAAFHIRKSIELLLYERPSCSLSVGVFPESAHERQRPTRRLTQLTIQQLLSCSVQLK